MYVVTIVTPRSSKIYVWNSDVRSLHPTQPFQDLLINQVLVTLDSLKSKHPDTGVVILVDLNRTNISLLCKAHSMKQFVDKPTKGNAILGLIVTNLESFYNIPVVCSPMGRSDHRI